MKRRGKKAEQESEPEGRSHGSTSIKSTYKVCGADLKAAVMEYLASRGVQIPQDAAWRVIGTLEYMFTEEPSVQFTWTRKVEPPEAGVIKDYDKEVHE